MSTNCVTVTSDDYVSAVAPRPQIQRLSLPSSTHTPRLGAPITHPGVTISLYLGFSILVVDAMLAGMTMLSMSYEFWRWRAARCAAAGRSRLSRRSGDCRPDDQADSSSPTNAGGPAPAAGRASHTDVERLRRHSLGGRPTRPLLPPSAVSTPSTSQNRFITPAGQQWGADQPQHTFGEEKQQKGSQHNAKIVNTAPKISSTEV